MTPKIKHIIGQNPQAPMIMAALQAHVAEHVGMEYKRQIEQMMGMSIPYSEDEDFALSPEQEMQITRMAVPAAQQLLGQNQTAIAAQQAQQAQQDPVIQMQMKELQLKQMEMDIKQKKMQLDAAARADQLEIEKQRIEAQKEIAGMQVGAKVQSEKAQLEAKQELEGMKLGHQIAQGKEQINMQRQSERFRASNNQKSKKDNK